VPVLDRGVREVRVPFFVKEIVAQLTFEARGSNEINQASGVSVRVTINNHESLLSNAEKRAVRTGEREIVPRLSDLPSVLASMAGKLELDDVGEDKKDGDLIDRLINRAVIKVWDKYLKDDVFEKLSEYLSCTGDVQQALDWLLHQGLEWRQGMRVMGLDDFLEQLREEMRARYREVNLRHALGEIRDKLEGLLDLERDALDALEDRARAARKRDLLDRLPHRLSEAL